MFDRAELEEMVELWLDANRKAQDANDWTLLGDFYADDATYGWMIYPDNVFMAVGKDEIRDVAIGLEMNGFDGWRYPYQSLVIDERQGMVIGLWRQVSDVLDEAGEPYEIHGIGGSWFRYAGDHQWGWQRDWFDVQSMTETVLALAGSGKAKQSFLDRLGQDIATAPGHYTRATLPVPLWPVPKVDQ